MEFDFDLKCFPKQEPPSVEDFLNFQNTNDTDKELSLKRVYTRILELNQKKIEDMEEKLVNYEEDLKRYKDREHDLDSILRNKDEEIDDLRNKLKNIIRNKRRCIQRNVMETVNDAVNTDIVTNELANNEESTIASNALDLVNNGISSGRIGRDNNVVSNVRHGMGHATSGLGGRQQTLQQERQYETSKDSSIDIELRENERNEEGNEDELEGQDQDEDRDAVDGETTEARFELDDSHNLLFHEERVQTLKRMILQINCETLTARQSVLLCIKTMLGLTPHNLRMSGDYAKDKEETFIKYLLLKCGHHFEMTVDLLFAYSLCQDGICLSIRNSLRRNVVGYELECLFCGELQYKIIFDNSRVKFVFRNKHEHKDVEQGERKHVCTFGSVKRHQIHVKKGQLTPYMEQEYATDIEKLRPLLHNDGNLLIHLLLIIKERILVLTKPIKAVASVCRLIVDYSDGFVKPSYAGNNTMSNNLSMDISDSRENSIPISKSNNSNNNDNSTDSADDKVMKQRKKAVEKLVKNVLLETLHFEEKFDTLNQIKDEINKLGLGSALEDRETYSRRLHDRLRKSLAYAVDKAYSSEAFNIDNFFDTE
ncbi:uncharacterized protein NDAI_0G00440 [Naumovozyma dairenensis CBS 421]|uniref:Uncharacterized protein n=1 Tax=Naumovozyma dairenensis (strain ATCC 10597 / BCRC 20456 / CBS 421 / NBRC 0211 / NRRL Y-12639) TaxID=1071378 RepID=G0WDF9_NAUDC|nr:hypothetical protein NDAI_0G00440 [Naumovozyma dairenensis CBS 421]CCD25820.2 hypothetical protein NDAI_0G00440 [Naumovozyma dairenensis CBS 421]